MPELVCRHDPELAVPDESPRRNAGWLLRWRHLGTARWPRVGRGSVVSEAALGYIPSTAQRGF